MRRIYTREELKTTFRINKKGELERLFKKKGWHIVKCVANNSNGYCQVWFKEDKISYHSIIWILNHGTITASTVEIDHINGHRIDNRIENLRLVSKRENQQNRHTHRSGRLAGVYFNKRAGKWQARIEINGKRIHLGHFLTEEEGHKAYCEAVELINEYIDNKQFKLLIKKTLSVK